MTPSALSIDPFRGAPAWLPLALRLASAHLALDAADRGSDGTDGGGAPNVFGYLARLRASRLGTLDAEAPDAGEVTIAETLRLSEALLLPADRTALRQLGVFPASFEEKAAAAITGADPVLLTRLVRRSMLERDGARYRLHDLAADYTRAQHPPEALTALHLAHARHYLAVLVEARNLYTAGHANITVGLALFDTERAHIEAAHAWLLAATLPERDELLIAFPDAFGLINQLRQHPRQRLAWLDAALAAARRTDDKEAEGRMLGNSGTVWRSLGESHRAIECHEQTLAISRQTGDRTMEGNALGNLGNAWWQLEDYRNALVYYEQQLTIARKLPNRSMEGNAQTRLGAAWGGLGDKFKAIEHFDAALAIHREVGDRRTESMDLNNLGNAWASLGESRKRHRLL